MKTVRDFGLLMLAIACLWGLLYLFAGAVTAHAYATEAEAIVASEAETIMEENNDCPEITVRGELVINCADSTPEEIEESQELEKHPCPNETYEGEEIVNCTGESAWQESEEQWQCISTECIGNSDENFTGNTTGLAIESASIVLTSKDNADSVTLSSTCCYSLAERKHTKHRTHHNACHRHCVTSSGGKVK